MNPPILFSLALLCTVHHALAQTTPPPAPPPAAPADAAQQIEVTGNRESDTEARRRATASKIVIGREEIDKFGDATLGEVLRRLPGVTTPGAPGRGGPPRMRGLGNGYTQLLIDGQRVPPGFSFESLTPEQIERIEILRAPTAETGARAIAGTINIITRDGFTRRLNDVRLGLGYENGRTTPGASWTHNNTSGALVNNLSGSVFENHRHSSGTTDTTDTDLRSGALVGSQRETAQTEERRQGLNLTTRLQWRLSDNGDQLMLMPSLFHTTAHSSRQLALTQSVPAGLPLYDTAQADTDSRFTNARLNWQWRQRSEGGLRMELGGGAGLWRSFSDTLRDNLRSGSTTPLRSLQDTSRTNEKSFTTTLKLSRLLGGQDAEPGSEHSLVGGAEIETTRRSETRKTLENGQALAGLDEGGGDNLQASSQRLAAYVQDEWQLSPHWGAHAGLRWEGINTRGEAADGTRPSNRSSVWTPLLHAVWKPDPKGRDQVRISLTRSYRAPGLGALIARPTLSSKFPTSVANDPTSPDRAGNPELRPELATGIDIALERYLSGGGVLSANVFRRNIKNLMRSITSPETVPWSAVPRFVARQQNVGNAVTQGVELEAKFRLDQAWPGATPVELRSNLSVFSSKVDGVPGPDNRLDQQAKATANLGADYRLRSLPLTLGGNLNWVPGYATQLSAEQRTSVSSKRVFDVFALWTINPGVGLRLLANNLQPRDYESSTSLDYSNLRNTAHSIGPSYVNWQLRLELKL